MKSLSRRLLDRFNENHPSVDIALEKNDENIPSQVKSIRIMASLLPDLYKGKMDPRFRSEIRLYLKSIIDAAETLLGKE